MIDATVAPSATGVNYSDILVVGQFEMLLPPKHRGTLFFKSIKRYLYPCHQLVFGHLYGYASTRLGIQLFPTSIWIPSLWL